jgi:hypothetical protein
VELLFFFAGRNALFIKDFAREMVEEGYNFSFFTFFWCPKSKLIGRGAGWQEFHLHSTGFETQDLF